MIGSLSLTAQPRFRWDLCRPMLLISLYIWRPLCSVVGVFAFMIAASRHCPGQGFTLDWFIADGGGRTGLFQTGVILRQRRPYQRSGGQLSRHAPVGQPRDLECLSLFERRCLPRQEPAWSILDMLLPLVILSGVIAWVISRSTALGSAFYSVR